MANEESVRLDAIVQSAMDGIITVDGAQRIVLFNEAAEQMFGCSAAEALGGPLERFIPERHRGAHRRHIELFARTGATSRRMGSQTALWALRTDGTEFPIEALISKVQADEQQLFTVILRDITGRLEADRKLAMAHEEMREGEAQLEAIVRSAMDAIITTDSAQRIILFNGAAEKLFGYPAAQALGAPLERFIPLRFRAAHAAHIERFVRTGETSRRMGPLTALWALHADGTEFPIEASISHATVAGHKLLTVILRDVTERLTSQSEIRRAHQEVREGGTRLEAIMRSAMDAIITIDQEQRVILWNAAAEKLFLCPADQAIGAPLDKFLPERFRAEHHGHIERFLLTGATSRRMGLQIPLWALRADGVEFRIEASISQAVVAGRPLLTVILRDITERANAEQELARVHEELRAASLAMLEVREWERTRIARELHDELGQALTALKMDIEFLGGSLPAEQSELRERTTAMKELAAMIVASTRRISADLRPLVLDDLGLVAAAEWVVQNVVYRAGLACDLRVDPWFADLGEPHASALFRIMQESLTNVARHARARRVELTLERLGNDAVLTVHDDGIGMEQPRQARPGSFGLRGIHERVLLLRGQLNITSRAGAGTTIVTRIPLGAEAREVA